MIRRAVARSSRPASKPAPAPASKPAPAPAPAPIKPPQPRHVSPVESPPQPRFTAVEIDEARRCIPIYVKRFQAAAAWNDRLAAEFEEAECAADVVRTALSHDTFQDDLSASIAEMKEQVLPQIVESRAKLQEEVCKLGSEVEGLESFVSGLKERFQRLASSLKFLGNHIDWLQQEMADLSVEFETRLVAATNVPVESSVPAKSPVETPAKSPVEIVISREASAREEPAVEPLAPALASALDPVELDPDLDPLPPDLVDEIPPESPLDSTLVESPGAPGNGAPRSPLDPPVDPDLDPVVLDPAVLDLRPPDEDPVDKPPDEISVDSAFDAAPAADPAVAPDKSPSKVSDRSPDIASCLPSLQPFSPATVGQPNGGDQCPSGEITPIPQRKFSSPFRLPSPSPSSSASSLPAPQVDLRIRPPDPLDAPSAREPPFPPESRSLGEDSAKRAENLLPDGNQRYDSDVTAIGAVLQLQEPRIRHDGEEHVMLAPKSLPEPSSVPRQSARLFGNPVFQPGPRFRSRRRRRLRQARRLQGSCRHCLPAPARIPPGGNSRRHLRRHTHTPSKFFRFVRVQAQKSSFPACLPVPRPRRLRERPRLRLCFRASVSPPLLSTALDNRLVFPPASPLIPPLESRRIVPHGPSSLAPMPPVSGSEPEFHCPHRRPPWARPPSRRRSNLPRLVSWRSRLGSPAAPARLRCPAPPPLARHPVMVTLSPSPKSVPLAPFYGPPHRLFRC
jgi:hypothetical protein